MADIGGGAGAPGNIPGGLPGGGALQGVVGAVDQALASLDPKTGAAVIGQVRQLLQYVPGVGGVAGTLDQLQAHLKSDRPDPQQVAPLLAGLARETRTAAGRAGPLGFALEQLAGRIETAAARLGGGPADRGLGGDPG